MKRDTDHPARRRPWLLWCATFLALALALVAIHQVVPHHPNHGRCQVCTSLDRPSVAATDVGIALPPPVSLLLPTAPDAVCVLSTASTLTPLRGPPTLLAV